MDKSTIRILLTIFMYVGVFLFLYPYATSHMSSGIYFLIFGALVAVTSGLLRCFLTEGDCTQHHQRHHTKTP